MRQRWSAMLADPKAFKIDQRCHQRLDKLDMWSLISSFSIQRRGPRSPRKKARIQSGHRHLQGHLCFMPEDSTDRIEYNVTEQLFQMLRSSGLIPTHWVVNVGAGNWEDPGYIFMKLDSKHKGVFIDPVGLPNGETSPPPGVTFLKAAATRGNFVSLLASGGLTCNVSDGPCVVDLLKIDIDSHDCELLADAIRVLRPRILWMEVNSMFPPPLGFTRFAHDEFFPFFRQWLRIGRLIPTLGCALSSASSELKRFGYRFHRLVENNAVFLDDELADSLGISATDETECFAVAMRSPGFHAFGPWGWVDEWRTMDPLQALQFASCNFTALHRLLDVSHLPSQLRLELAL